MPLFVFSEEKSTTPSSLANCTNYPLDFCAFRCCRHALRKSADISTFYRHSPKMNRKRYHSQKSNQKHTIIMKGVRRLHWKGSRGCAPCPRSANCLPCRLVRYTYNCGNQILGKFSGSDLSMQILPSGVRKHYEQQQNQNAQCSIATQCYHSQASQI